MDSSKEKVSVAEKIRARFSKIPNTGHMELWIQRATLPIDNTIRYDETICRLVSGEKVTLWNIDWIAYKELRRAIATSEVIDQEKVKALQPVISPDEVELFFSRAIGGYYT